MRLTSPWFLAALSVAALFGCSSTDDSSDPAPGADGGVPDTALEAPAADTAVDAPVPDTAVDAPVPDTAVDSPEPDAAADTSLPPDDAALDAAEESSTEASTEASTDAPTHLIATIETSLGTIRVQLAEAEAPVTVANFRQYADTMYYDGLLFHRVIPDFMIQGGGLEPGMQERDTTFPPIVNEAATSGLSNLRGTISMARTTAPNSATSQFFINTDDNTFLDAGGSTTAGYAVFGEVVEGMDVVEQIEAVPTHSVGMYDDVPVDDVLITSIRVAEE